MDATTTRTWARSRLTLPLLAFGMLIIAVDFNIVYVALPEIGRKLGFTVQNLQWVVSAYAVTWGGFLLLGGRAVDRLGPRRMFIFAMTLYATSSLAGGLASDIGVLIGARAVQGVGAAVLFPAVLALININFAEGPARTRAMAVWGAASASGLIVGSTAGGVLTHLLGWPWVFFVNVPLAIGAIAAALWLLTRDPAAHVGAFDLPGALLATAGATLAVFGLVSASGTGWVALRGAGALAAGVVLLMAFVLVERRNADVLMPPRLFRRRTLTLAVTMVVLFMTAINFLHYSFFIQLQHVLGHDALRAGLAFIPVSAGGVLGSHQVLPAILTRWGKRVALLVGILGLGVSMVAIAPTLSLAGSYWLMVPGALAWGLSAGIAFPAIFLVASAGASATEHGVVSATVSTAQQIGGAMGLAVLVAVATAGLSTQAPTASEVVAGLRTGMWIGAIVLIVGALLALTVDRRHPT